MPNTGSEVDIEVAGSTQSTEHQEWDEYSVIGKETQGAISERKRDCREPSITLADRPAGLAPHHWIVVIAQLEQHGPQPIAISITS